MNRSTAVAAALALVLIATACGASASHPRSGGTGTTTLSGAVDPNAPEVVAPGDIPDTQVFVPLVDPRGRYSLQVPEGWSRSNRDATVTVTDHYNAVDVTTARVESAPTATGARATELPFLRRHIPNFALVKIETVTRAAGQAVLVSYRAGSAPDPVTAKRVALDVERYEFWRNGILVTLTLSGARGSDNVDPWKTITDSFQWTP